MKLKPIRKELVAISLTIAVAVLLVTDSISTAAGVGLLTTIAGGYGFTRHRQNGRS